MIFLEDVGLGDDRPEKQCPKCGETWPASHLDTDSGNCITCEDAEEEEPSIFDIEVPEWADVTEQGIWCSFCGDLLVASFHVDHDTTCPEECPTCGAPDPESMAGHFA